MFQAVVRQHASSNGGSNGGNSSAESHSTDLFAAPGGGTDATLGDGSGADPWMLVGTDGELQVVVVEDSAEPNGIELTTVQGGGAAAAGTITEAPSLPPTAAAVADPSPFEVTPDEGDTIALASAAAVVAPGGAMPRRKLAMQRDVSQQSSASHGLERIESMRSLGSHKERSGSEGTAVGGLLGVVVVGMLMALEVRG